MNNINNVYDEETTIAKYPACCDNKNYKEENENISNANKNVCVADEFEESFKNHAALCEVSENKLHEMLSGDSLLSDIPYDISHEEVLAQVRKFS